MTPEEREQEEMMAQFDAMSERQKAFTAHYCLIVEALKRHRRRLLSADDTACMIRITMAAHAQDTVFDMFAELAQQLIDDEQMARLPAGIVVAKALREVMEMRTEVAKRLRNLLDKHMPEPPAKPKPEPEVQKRKGATR